MNFRKKGRLVFASAVLLLSGCAAPVSPPESAPVDKMRLDPAAFSDLRGWEGDRHGEALAAFKRSCSAGLRKKSEWGASCAAAAGVDDKDHKAARRFFEANFRPWSVSGEAGREGLFTGYYEAELNGSLRRGGKYQTPLWQPPRDFLTADLGAFRPSLKGQKISGKAEGNAFVPYDDRAAIASGSLAEGERAQPLLWADDPVDVFFLEVQGSGRVKMDDGSTARVGYAGQNGRQYVAIGKVLADSGELERPVTMAKIRDWLRSHPERAQATMNANPSAVFFRFLRSGAVGAEGSELTPERSLAVDRAFVALGTPVWLETKDDGATKAINRLMVAQDTGGAIKGVVRGDVFWGHGKAAEGRAGAMQSRGAYYLLLPK